VSKHRDRRARQWWASDAIQFSLLRRPREADRS
jgi:hypothetical protein